MSYKVKMEGMGQNLKIAVVGTGGTGGFIAESLCRLLADNDVPLLLVDHDRVEPHNLLRQNFFAEDIGKFKAQALAERLARKYGRRIGYMVYPFDREMLDDNMGTGFTRKAQALIIGCVDRPSARRSIATGMNGAGGWGDWWIDAGNGHHSGQVLIGNVSKVDALESGFDEALHTVSRLPIPSLQIPALLFEPTKPARNQRDCAEEVLNEEQSPVINQAMATLVLQVVDQLLKGTLTWMGVYLDLEAGTMATVPAEPETIARMFDVKVGALMAQPCSRGLLTRP